MNFKQLIVSIELNGIFATKKSIKIKSNHLDILTPPQCLRKNQLITTIAKQVDDDFQEREINRIKANNSILMQRERKK